MLNHMKLQTSYTQIQSKHRSAEETVSNKRSEEANADKVPW